MESLEDPVFKTKYQKNKLRVKLWESDFMEKYGRKPNKNDIRAADNTIKESYKMYWKLKTQVLDETLLDITFSDEVHANVTANTSTDASLPFSPPNDFKNLDNSSPECTLKNSENIDPGKSENIGRADTKEPFSAVVPIGGTPNVEGAWGAHLSKANEEKKPSIKKNLIIGRSSSFQLSQKLFTSSNLTKRNPRKSLSMNKLKNSKSNLSLEGSMTETSNDKSDGFDPTTSFFGETIKVVESKTKVSSQSINTIQQLIKGGTPTINRNLNPGWLARVSKENGLGPMLCTPERLSGTSDSGIESMDLSIPLTIENMSIPMEDKIVDFTDEEDFICNSDSEEDRRKKRVTNFKKRLSDGASQPLSKRQRLEPADEFSFSQPLPSTQAMELLSPKPVEIQERPLREIHDQVMVREEKKQEGERITVKSTTSVSEDQNQILDEDYTEINKQDVGEKMKGRKTTRAVKAKPKTKDSGISARTKKTTTVPKKRVTRQKSRKTAESLHGETSENSCEDTDTSVVGKKTTIVTRKRVTRSRRRKVDEPSDEENIANSSDSPNIPIYGIEATEVVPRFALPTNESGDLVIDFSRTVASNDLTLGTTDANPKGKLTAREKLEQKVASGRVNENFVRINLKKKVFVRGKKNFNASKYRKNQWKERKKDLASSAAALDRADYAEKNDGTCFKCGGTGHFARRCTGAKSEDLLPNTDDVPSEFLTLEEVEKMAAKAAVIAHSSKIDSLPKCPSFSQAKSAIAKEPLPSSSNDEKCVKDDEDYDTLLDEMDFDEEIAWEPEPCPTKLQGHKIPEELLAKLLPPLNGAVEPICPAHVEINGVETPAEVFEALRMFGHETFRPGQEKAIMRILSGKSTLVTLSTGSGKSLCYQLPAYIYAKRSKCITLVVSPLVSLMDDQVTGVPVFLSAAALHTGQTPKVKEQVMQQIKAGEIDILLVSPEAVVAGEKSTGFGALLRQLPPIAFACIDEAHCISQWSHNFRPSYLMLCRVLIEKLGVKTILGLTATATKATAESIVKHLNIIDGLSGIISDTPMPKNLTLTVSKDEHKDRALVDLILSERFKELNSIIVYCTRRDETTRVAGLLRISLEEPQNRGVLKNKCSPYAEAYHAGLPAGRRKAIQKSFMSGKTRIVVATVAFGMGINKSDIRSVIHYNMPGSFEGYVQEVGRAGRDNLPAHCHLFLSPSQNGDKLELRRHIFANGVDRHMIRRLLQKIFVPCSCPRVENDQNLRRCPGHEVAIPIDETVRALDISEETISTLLCYLELHPKRFISVLSSVYVNAKVASYGGPRALKIAAQTSPPLAMAIALDLKKGISHNESTIIEFPVVDIAAAIGWDSGIVKSHLKNLEWHTVDGRSERSTITVRYDTLGIRVRAPGDMTDAELDEALEALFDRVRVQETSSLQQLEIIHSSLSNCSVQSVRQCMELNDDILSKSESLKETIREYFRADSPLSTIELSQQNECSNEAEITSDVRSLISSYRDNNFTGRAVARIFHGIQSPNYSALTWSRCRFWRSHLDTDFNFICRIATREILAIR